MSVQPLVPWLLIAMLLSIAVMVVGAAAGDGALHLLAAVAYGAALTAAGIAVNYPYWVSRSDDGVNARAIASRRNARLFTFAYAWGGAAMAAVYSLTSLRWRHDWQYALAMIIAAIVCFAYALRVTHPRTRLGSRALLRAAAVLAGLQAIGAAIGLVHLFTSGKIWTFGGDWAANHIFLVGAAMLVVLSLFALASYRQTAASGA